MKQDESNFNSAPNLIVHAPVQKKKIIIAVGLMTVMVFMWIRVFMPEKTTSVHGATATTPDSNYEQNNNTAKIKLSYVELPILSGRNDTITRDVFSSEGWSPFGDASSVDDDNSNTNVDIESQNKNSPEKHKANLRQIAEKIKLDAILTTDNKQQASALIEDKLVTVGSEVPIEYNSFKYIFTVTEINKTSVILNWENFNITVKMLQPALAE